MALKLMNQSAGEQRYLKVTGLSLNTVSAVTGSEHEYDNLPARVDVTVHFNIYKNQDERFNPDPEFAKWKTESRTFNALPDATADNEFNRQITRGYALLRTLDEFGTSVWEDYQ